MKLSKHFAHLTKEEEDAYLEDKTFALLNGYPEWEKSIPSYTLFQALSVFPEAKPLVRKELKEELKENHKHGESLDEYYRKEENRIMETTKSYHEVVKLKQELIAFCERHQADLIDKAKRIRFNLARIDGKAPKGEIGAEEIEKAKSVLITELIEFSHGKAKCLWHEDLHPSLSYDRKTNRVKCFSCDKGEDAIGVIQTLQSCDFISAVKILLKK